MVTELTTRECIWTGDEGRPLRASRPCACGCDTRDGVERGVGYITGSTPEGRGVTVWIEDEATFARLKEVLDGRDD